MLVRAKELCIIGSFRKRPGDEFEFELGEGQSLPKHLELVSEVPEPKTLKAGDEVIVAGKKARIPKTLHDHDETRNVPARASAKEVI